MPYSCRRPRLAASARISVRLTPEQRDWLLHAPDLPQKLGHLLHRAAVREGKLAVRLNHEELETTIMVAAKIRPAGKSADRGLDALLRYLELQADRFAEPNNTG